jgi:hypothetical protein
MIQPILRKMLADDHRRLSRAVCRQDPRAWWSTIQHLTWVIDAIGVLNRTPADELVRQYRTGSLLG